MSRTPFDVVISDMRMPGMTGAQLLNEIMQHYPRTARLILSAYSDQEMIAQCVGATHQYLSKPCNLNTLRSTLTRICALDTWVMDQRLASLVAQVGALPSLPSLYFRLLELLESPTATTEQVGELIAMDLGMTAKILQLVNSAFFGVGRKIGHPAEAVQFLGVGTVRSIALSLHLFSCFDSSKLRRFPMERLWSHSIVTGVVARKIAEAERVNVTTSDESFIAGMLHDLGKLMLASSMPDQYEEVLRLVQSGKASSDAAERSIFGASHADVGAYLLGLWGLPASIVEAIALHHHPNKAVDRTFSPLTAVHAANVLEHERFSPPEASDPHELDKHYLAELGLYDRVPAWREIVTGMPIPAVLDRGTGTSE